VRVGSLIIALGRGQQSQGSKPKDKHRRVTSNSFATDSPRKRTLVERVVMSALCQKRTFRIRPRLCGATQNVGFIITGIVWRRIFHLYRKGLRLPLPAPAEQAAGRGVAVSSPVSVPDTVELSANVRVRSKSVSARAGVRAAGAAISAPRTSAVVIGSLIAFTRSLPRFRYSCERP
jgi:hypothetical protein